MTYCWSCLEFLPCGSYQFLSVLLQKLAKCELIQYNVDQNEVVRNEKGYCVPVAPGMLIKFTFGNELDFAKAKLWATSNDETGPPLRASGQIQTFGG